jgi:FlgD Ig-like domain
MLLVVGLLGGTAAAFAVTEGLKLQKSPILGTLVTPKVISPVCDCPTHTTSIAFRLRHADHLTITIENSSGRSVRTLFSNRAIGDGPQTFFWNGRLADGRVAPDGDYKANLELDDADRSITLPNRIAIDTKRPHVLSVGVDLKKTRVVVRYRASEPAHGILFVGGQRVVVTYRSPAVGTMQISRLSLQERSASGHLAVAVRDRAGNRSKIRVLRYVIRRSS